MSNNIPVIRTYDLTKRFKNLTAVDQVNFEVQRGEVYGFLGPNGAGETTTIALLLGLVRPTAGSAEVLGHDIRHDLSAALRHAGAIVEAPAFYPYLSAAYNLRIFAHNRRANQRPGSCRNPGDAHLYPPTLGRAGQNGLHLQSPAARGGADMRPSADPEQGLCDHPGKGIRPAQPDTSD